MWHRVLKSLNKRGRISFSREELNEVLNSPNYTPKALLSLFKKDLDKEFNAASGVREKYSIKRHTLMVMGQYEKYFGKSEMLASVSKTLFRTFLALHDIGKSDAIRKTGDKHNQHRYTVEIMSSVLSQLGFSEQEVKIALALVSEDIIGGYIRGHFSGKEATEELTKMADDVGLPFYDFLRLLLIYYQVDAGSYTEDAGGLKSLDHLFVFDKGKGQMDFSVNVAAKVDQLKIYAEALPNALWLNDHDWYDIPYDNLKAWVKGNKSKLDSGDIIKGNTFSYRFEPNTGQYQVQLGRNIKEALYTPRSILLLDNNWHDLVFDDLKEWVKKNNERLQSGEELKGKMFRYRLNRKTGKYQVRLSSRVKEALYSY
ncbi:hypothetical protein ACFLWK_00815 [Chloroflexota bacterium]